MSESFLNDITTNMGPQISSQLSTQLGMNQDQAQQALEKVAPLILGGLKRQAEQHGGEGRVNHIVQKYGRESVLDDLGTHIQRKAEDPNPDPTLGGLLGDAGPQAAGLLDNKLGLSAGMGKKLIPILAPIILGALKKRANATGRPQAGGAGSGSGGGLLTSILDRDGDGSMLDDVAGMVFGGGASGRHGGGGGFLKKLLSMLFGRKG